MVRWAVGVERAHVVVDRHVVVVEDDEHVVRGVGRVVDALEGKTSGY